jgi:hypothetical protein
MVILPEGSLATFSHRQRLGFERDQISHASLYRLGNKTLVEQKLPGDAGVGRENPNLTLNLAMAGLDVDPDQDPSARRL